MKIVPAQVLIPLRQFDGLTEEIAAIARTCYKSEDDTRKTPEELVRSLIERDHVPMLDHRVLSVKVTTNRGVTHEIVRHRVGAAYAQESTRYCNYSAERFGDEVTFLDPKALNLTQAQYNHWKSAQYHSEFYYLNMLKAGSSPQQAREALSNAVKADIVITLSLTAWLHFFYRRCSSAAHPQMREIALPIAQAFSTKLPTIFGAYEELPYTPSDLADVVWTDNLFKPLEVQP